MPETSFSSKLLKWFMKNARVMPWRALQGKVDPYKIWISEVMLQQTTVATVLKRYPQWLNTYPSIKALAAASEQSVLKEWQGLGYYNRARNLLRCARILVEKHNAKLPDTAEKLQDLPGFGRYTAAAVASIAFGRRVPLVDANVRRVMQRVLAITGPATIKNDPCILHYLNTTIPPENPGHFNQAMMELGATVCRPSEPCCNLCPIRDFCAAYSKGIQEIIPEPAVKNIQKVNAVVAIIWFKNKVLIQQRPSKGLLADLWEFPGGKIEPTDKSMASALRREVFEETGLTIKALTRLGQVTHSYTRFKVNLTAYRCTVKDGILQNNRLKLVTKDQLKDYPMPSGSAKLVDRFILQPK